MDEETKRAAWNIMNRITFPIHSNYIIIDPRLFKLN